MMAVSDLIPQAMEALATPEPEPRNAVCPKHGAYESRIVATLPSFAGRPPVYRWGTCPDCAIEAKATQEAALLAAETSQRQQRLDDAIGRSGIPRRFLDCTFENFEATDERQAYARDKAKAFADDFRRHREQGTVLVFAGNIGTGKGHLAIAAAHQVLQAGSTVLFASAREIVLMLRESWNGNHTAPSELQVLRRLCAVDLLIIDEVGVQFGTDAERDQLFGVIDGRYRDRMPSILTTNLPKTKLKDVLGERNFSRLRQDGFWVPFTWEDYRAAKKAGKAV